MLMEIFPVLISIFSPRSLQRAFKKDCTGTGATTAQASLADFPNASQKMTARLILLPLHEQEITCTISDFIETFFKSQY